MWTLQRCPSSRWCGRVFFWQAKGICLSPKLLLPGKRHCFYSGRSEKQCFRLRKHDSQGFPKMGVSNMKITLRTNLWAEKFQACRKLGVLEKDVFSTVDLFEALLKLLGRAFVDIELIEALSFCFWMVWNPQDSSVPPFGLDFLLEGQKLDLRAEVQRCADPWGCQKVVKVVILFGLEEHTHTIFVLKPILKQPFLVPDVWANYVWLILMFSDLRSRPCNK